MGGMGGMPGMEGLGGMGGMPGMEGLGGMGGMGGLAGMMGGMGGMGGMGMPPGMEGLGGMGMDDFEDESDDEGWYSCACYHFLIIVNVFLDTEYQKHVPSPNPNDGCVAKGIFIGVVVIFS